MVTNCIFGQTILEKWILDIYFCPFSKFKKTFPTKIFLKNIINWNSYLKTIRRADLLPAAAPICGCIYDVNVAANIDTYGADI